jgi:transcriptional regulator with XRE-family HTH domain
MDLASFRKSRGLSQEQCASELDLQSKGYISSLESGAAAAPLRVALRVHRWSAGQVPADSLVSPEDAELLQAYRAMRPEAAA